MKGFSWACAGIGVSIHVAQPAQQRLPCMALCCAAAAASKKKQHMIVTKLIHWQGTGASMVLGGGAHACS